MEINHTNSNIIIHPHNNQKIYDTFVNMLKQLKEKICISHLNLLNPNDNIDRLNSEIKESFEEIDDMLYQIANLKKEYLNFLSIKRTTFYILDNKTLYCHISSIEKLFDSFYNLIYLKNTLSEKEYDKFNSKFNRELLKFEQHFYTMVCKPSENYNEDVLSSIINSLI